MMHLKPLEKQEPPKHQISTQKEMIKIRAEINEVETKNKQGIDETKSYFSKKINKIDKLLIILLEWGETT